MNHTMPREKIIAQVLSSESHGSYNKYKVKMKIEQVLQLSVKRSKKSL